jgi:hypothetical protein
VPSKASPALSALPGLATLSAFVLALGSADQAAAAPPGEDEVQEEASPRPPRVDGAYLGLSGYATTSFTRVDNLNTPDPLVGGFGGLSVGDAVFPWFTIGLQVGGSGGVTPTQRISWGGILVELGFLPAPRYPFSIRTGFGFGAGAVRDDGVAGRFGFGGAMFKGALRYDFFPLANKKRPTRGGGWSIAPEIGWIGHTPAGKGRPMANTLFVGLFSGFYFGS